MYIVFTLCIFPEKVVFKSNDLKLYDKEKLRPGAAGELVGVWLCELVM